MQNTVKPYQAGLHDLNIPLECCGRICNGKYKVYGRMDEGGCQGPCRLVDIQGNVIEGFFQNGSCEKAYVYYAYANFAVGEWKQDGLNGKATIYNLKGTKQYAGEVKNGKRHGDGTQYNEISQISLVGTWDNDSKEGWFEEVVDDSKHNEKMEGCYEDDVRNGEFQHWMNDVLVDVKNFYLGRLVKSESEIPAIEQELAKRKADLEAQKQKQTKSLTLYNITLPQQCVTDLQYEKMLDTAILTVFARRIFHYLQAKHFGETKKPNHTFLFGTDLLETYATHSLQSSHYDRVEHMTRHLQGNFSLVSGFWQTIMFPMTNGPHFTLAVVRILHTGGNYTFLMEYYDSLNGRYQLEKVCYIVKSFLHNEYVNHYPMKNEDLRRALMQMKPISVSSPHQYDGYSCGVFVCKFMYELAIKQRLVDLSVSTYISNFRQIIINFLQSGIEMFHVICQMEQNLYANIQKYYESPTRRNDGRKGFPESILQKQSTIKSGPPIAAQIVKAETKDPQANLSLLAQRSPALPNIKVRPPTKPGTVNQSQASLALSVDSLTLSKRNPSLSDTSKSTCHPFD